jgi:hypothetical protein
MASDRNLKIGKDQSFSEGARRVTDFLWENAGSNVSSYPKSYLENLRYEFSDGKVSMLELIDRVDLGPEASYEDYCEVIEELLSVDPSQWPDPESVVEIQPSHLQFEIEPEYDFSEFDFAEEIVEEEVIEGQPDPVSEKMELFLKKVISSVYRDGVTEVTDLQGNPPNESNNYLLSEDGNSFSGIFYDSPPDEEARKFPFKITEGEGGVWNIKY